MKRRLNKGLLVTFGLLVVLNVIRHADLRGPDESTSSNAPLLPAFEADDVDEITWQRGTDDPVRMTRDGAVWRLADGRAAHGASIRELLGLLELMPLGRTIATSLDVADRFDLHDEACIRVTAKSGTDILANLRFGVMDSRGSFFRLESEDLVRKSPGDASSVLRPARLAVYGWRDDVVLEEGPADEVLSIRIHGPEQSLRFEAEVTEVGRVWWLREPQDGPAVAWQCEQMAEDLSHLEADRFFVGERSRAELGLDPPEWRVVATRQGGTSTTLELGTATIDGRMPVSVPGDDTVYLVAAFRVANFQRRPEDYLEGR